MNRRIFEWNASHNLDIFEIVEFSKKLDAITGNADVNTQYANIKEIWGWPRNGEGNSAGWQAPESKWMRDCAHQRSKNERRLWWQTLADIDKDGKTGGGELLRAARQITKNCRQHTDELIVAVKDCFGNVVEIMRDNNIEERGHRWSRMHLRWRTGRTRTTNEMAHYGALTAIFSNMDNETYVMEVLSDVKDLIREIQDITPEEIRRSRDLIRPYMRKEMVRYDAKRTEILWEFVDLLEVECSVEGWLSKLDFSNAIMTP